MKIQLIRNQAENKDLIIIKKTISVKDYLIFDLKIMSLILTFVKKEVFNFNIYTLAKRSTEEQKNLRIVK